MEYLQEYEPKKYQNTPLYVLNTPENIMETKIVQGATLFNSIQGLEKILFMPNRDGTGPRGGGKRDGSGGGTGNQGSGGGGNRGTGGAGPKKGGQKGGCK